MLDRATLVFIARRSAIKDVNLMGNSGKIERSRCLMLQLLIARASAFLPIAIMKIITVVESVWSW